jgi:hypothetical protein
MASKNKPKEQKEPKEHDLPQHRFPCTTKGENEFQTSLNPQGGTALGQLSSGSMYVLPAHDETFVIGEENKLDTIICNGARV